MALRRRKPLPDADRARVIVLASDPQLLGTDADSYKALLDLLAPALSPFWSSSHLSMMPAFPVIPEALISPAFLAAYFQHPD
jgi:hypothetical protein